MSTERIEKARRILIAARNTDGGWPYIPGKPSAPEPTCYAVMALAARGFDPGGEWRSAIAGANRAAGSEWARSLELLALSRLQASPDARAKLAEQLLEVRVRQIESEDVNKLDGTLRGWAWFDDTFSWVEPTSYALLALKASGYGKHPRVKEAERLLLDRACADGGWNYGNKKVFGADVPSMPPTTALAAVALQDFPPAAAKIKPALDLLEREVLAYPSALSLSLAVLCLHVFARSAGNLAAALLQTQNSDGSWRRQVHLTALSVLALDAHSGGSNVFKTS